METAVHGSVLYDTSFSVFLNNSKLQSMKEK